MIPLKLTLSGFLSYREPVTLDFTPLTLACISGPNGAGKSSLLDAITWALFGQARQRGDAVIHTSPDVKAAEVVLTFTYEDNVYKVRRQRERNKSTLLEFHIQTAGGQWKPLTERTLRDTQARIEETLRMDYDTFIHASFFLQGEADKFSRERPTKRKEVLTRILGLQVWETYRQRAAERRRAVEEEIQRLDARMSDMRAEIQYEAEIQTQLREVEADIQRLEALAAEQEALLRERAQAQAVLAQQQALVDELAHQIHTLETRLTELTARLATRQQERERHQALLARAAEIRKAYATLQTTREALGQWDALAMQFHELNAQRQPLLQTIAAEKAKLQEALENLQRQARQAEETRQRLAALEQALQEAQARVEAASQALAEAEAAQNQLAELSERLGQLAAQRDQLAQEGNDYKARIAQLEAVHESECPLCGQPLTAQHRENVLAQWQTQVETLRAQYQEINAQIGALREAYHQAQALAERLPELRRNHQQALRHLERLKAEHENLTATLEAWEKEGQPQLDALRRRLEANDFAQEARGQLQTLDERLRRLGYDPEAHAQMRQTEETLRHAEEDYRALESARAALQPLEREIADLEAQIQSLQAQHAALSERHAQASRQLAEAQQQAPNLEEAERALTDLRERIADLQKTRGGHQQMLHTIAKYKKNLTALAAQRETLAQTIGRYKTLEEAFGKNGVPALLIEQALPMLENEANRLLERLTDGRMAVHFRTQRAYKDPKRPDMRETLDILISDENGTRDYESYSGGEAFRVDFAIRVALARMLAHRAGARLQTLVIDEGFGSQDAEGRQRLIEAIRAVQEEFAKILVITHIEELKEAFPARIEVRKTPRGSQAEVVLL